MAALKEVIIGNLRLAIVGGPSPKDRQMVIQGYATIYDQDMNSTRSYAGDLTSALTGQEQSMCEDLLARLIQGVMAEYNITQADLNEGQAILDAIPAQPQGVTAMAAPLPSPAPPPMPAVATQTTIAPNTPRVQPGEGEIAGAGSQVATEPVSTETGEGEIYPVIPPEPTE